MRITHRVLFAAALACLMIGRLFAGPDNEKVGPASLPVILVSGDPIDGQEWREEMRRQRPRHPDPADLRQATQEACVRFKVIEQMARSHHWLAEIDDASLRRAWAEENRRRAAALARGQVVYGPRRLEWEPFRSYWLDGIERRLRAAVAEAHGPATAAELKAFYNAHPELFTARGASAPLPFAEMLPHLEKQYFDAAYQTAVRVAIAAAVVRPNAALIGQLTP